MALTGLSPFLSITKRSSLRQWGLALFFLFAGTVCPNTQNNQSSKLGILFPCSQLVQ